MKLAIMQPYFFPYIGYFQLMNAVDEFVVYDNIQFSKEGWINRNRILVNGKDAFVTLPLKKASDFLDIGQRRLAESWQGERKKILNRIAEAYRKAPYFKPVFALVEASLLSQTSNLFEFLLNSLKATKTYLGIPTPLITASEMSLPVELKAEKRVLAICQSRKAETYINPIGGTALYQKPEFQQAGVDLFFLKTQEFSYPQFGNEFIPSLSIIDVMMFNPVDKIKTYLTDFYSLI